MIRKVAEKTDDHKKYDIVLIDPPWPMHGDPNKNAAAGILSL